jgi:hypothetical protein
MTQIAATALIHDLTLVTRNEKHFAGTQTFQPIGALGTRESASRACAAREIKGSTGEMARGSTRRVMSDDSAAYSRVKLAIFREAPANR